MAVPKRVEERMRAALKTFLPILVGLRDRDVAEADTVTIVKDLLSELFGYDKYKELSGEYAIRGNFCDLAVKVEGKLRFLIEVKAIGVKLNDRHAKQAVDYATNQGVDWVILTNGMHWMVYHVLFKKPIDTELIAEYDLTQINLRQEESLDKLYLISKEGIGKNALSEFRELKNAANHYMLAAILLNSDAILSTIRREVRRVSDVLVDTEAIIKVLREDVIKREALEGDLANDATRRVTRGVEKGARAEKSHESVTPQSEAPTVNPTTLP